MEEKIKVLYDLCETLSRALKDANEKIRNAGGKLGAGDLDYLDKLTHSLKSIKTTIAMMESEGEEDDGYSERSMASRRSYAGGGMSGRSYQGNSYARRRDSMGRYARDDGYSYGLSFETMINDLRGSMDELPEDKRREVQRFIERMDRM